MSNRMNFLDKLLHGVQVEWKTLGEVAEINRGRRLVKNQLEETGKYAVFQNSMTPLGYYHESNVQADTVFIISAGSAGEIGYSSVGFWAADDVYYFVTPENLKSKFLFYFLLTQQVSITGQVRRSSVPRLSKTAFEKLLIPIPPLNVQKEIVRILDTLTELTTELTAELTARKTQYNYYREQLFNFETTKGTNDTKNVEWKTLGEIGEVRMCKRILKEQTSDDGEIPFYKIGTFGKEPDAFISKELYTEYKSKYNYPKIGEVLISASGTIGRAVIFDGRDAYFQDSNIVWIENEEKQVLNKYLFYFYQVAKWEIADGGTIQRLYNDNLRKTKIPVPPLEEQARIVSILDKFDTLTTSITEGLPKEIALRKKQYEYYRDMLLTFPTTNHEKHERHEKT